MDFPDLTFIECNVFDKLRDAYDDPDDNCLELSDYTALNRLRKKGIVGRGTALTELGIALAAAMDA